jgi:hypothetical protein
MGTPAKSTTSSSSSSSSSKSFLEMYGNSVQSARMSEFADDDKKGSNIKNRETVKDNTTSSIENEERDSHHMRFHHKIRQVKRVNIPKEIFGTEIFHKSNKPSTAMAMAMAAAAASPLNDSSLAHIISTFQYVSCYDDIYQYSLYISELCNFRYFYKKSREGSSTSSSTSSTSSSTSSSSGGGNDSGAEREQTVPELLASAPDIVLSQIEDEVILVRDELYDRICLKVIN